MAAQLGAPARQLADVSVKQARQHAVSLRLKALNRAIAHCRHRSAARDRSTVASSSAAGSVGGGSQGEPQQPIDVQFDSVDAATGTKIAEQVEDPAVKEALLRVQAALSDAERNVQVLHKLPSARLPSAWDRTLRTLRPFLQFAALTAGCAAMHSLGMTARLLGSLAGALGVALYGWRKESLSRSGAVAAALVGWGTLAASFRSGLLLLTFFFASSQLTKMGEEIKAEIDDDHKKGGQRDWAQVCCNGLVPTALALAAAYFSGGADLALGAVAPAGSAAAGTTVSAKLLTALSAGFLGYYACCCGDTWASELGQLSPEEPVLITSLRPVRRGTNGGVTLVGLAASMAGGLAMGLTFFACTLLSPTRTGSLAAAAAQWWRLLLLGAGAGVVGSLIDSLLGASVQFTGYNRATGKITGRPGPDVSPISGFALLDNNMVNAVSASGTAALTAALCTLVC